MSISSLTGQQRASKHNYSDKHFSRVFTYKMAAKINCYRYGTNYKMTSLSRYILMMSKVAHCRPRVRPRLHVVFRSFRQVQQRNETAHQVGGVKQREDADPEAVFERVVGPGGRLQVARWWRDWRRAHHVLAHGRQVRHDDARRRQIVQTAQSTCSSASSSRLLVIGVLVWFFQLPTGRPVHRRLGLPTLHSASMSRGKGRPYSTTERRVPELIPVLGSQPARDVSRKPSGRLPLLSARPEVTLATLKRAATNSAAW